MEENDALKQTGCTEDSTCQNCFYHLFFSPTYWYVDFIWWKKGKIQNQWHLPVLLLWVTWLDEMAGRVVKSSLMADCASLYRPPLLRSGLIPDKLTQQPVFHLRQINISVFPQRLHYWTGNKGILPAQLFITTATVIYGAAQPDCSE